MLERFAADRNLGKLAKWLRILGYDTLYDRNDADRDRKRELAHRVHLGPLVVVKADHVEGQLSEVITALDLEPDPSRRMARCLNCNAPLEEVPKASLEGLVPIYVFGTCTQFRRCPLCKRIFWPGTHSRHVEERLSAQFPHRDLSF
jgi:uncharacterized protein with PIN domain